MFLGIYGAGELGKEIMILANMINERDHRWDEIVFIDNKEDFTVFKGKKVITFEKAKSCYTNQDMEFIVAVGEPKTRRLLRENIAQAGFSLAVLVHPSIRISEGTALGAGTIVSSNCFISCDTTIEENVLLQPFVSIGHDCNIKKDTVISTFVCISGDCTIGKETYIGIHTAIKEKTVIGSQTIIGMGSVVVRDIPDQVIAMGNPARIMKENSEHKVFHAK